MNEKCLIESTDKLLLIRCGGKHAAVVWDSCREHYLSTKAKIIVWDDNGKTQDSLPKCHIVTSFESIRKIMASNSVNSVDVLVCTGNPILRKKLVDEIEENFVDYLPILHFPSIIHKTSSISSSALIEKGCYIGAFAVVNVSAHIGSFCIVNSHAVVDHDCFINNYATINPGAVLCGTVVVGNNSVIGANATVRDHCAITSNVVVGMGAGVVSNIDCKNSVWMGIPAKQKQKNQYASTNNEMINQPKSIRWCVYKPMLFPQFQKYLEISIEARQITNDGPLMEITSSKLLSLTGSKKSTLLAANGTAALHALVAGYTLKFGKNLRWATQAFTFPSSIQGPLYDSIVFDTDEKSWGPSFISMEQRKNEFDGIIVTNVFGYQCDILKYEKWCNDNNKILLFDNAATPYTFAKDGRPIVDIGQGSIVSLHETKPIGRGEGGAIFMDIDLKPFVHRAMNFGFDIPNNIRIGDRLSSNWRMSDIAAAAICCHLDNIMADHWKESYNVLLRKTLDFLKFKNISIEPVILLPSIVSCLFVRVSPKLEGKIDELCLAMNSNIPRYEAKHYYLPLGTRESYPIAWKMYDRSICLPFHIDADFEDIQAMIETYLVLSEKLI